MGKVIIPAASKDGVNIVIRSKILSGVRAKLVHNLIVIISTSCRIIFLLIALTAFTGCSMIIDRPFDPSRTVEAENRVALDPLYREKDKICRNIIPPEGSKLIGKALLNNSVGILYYYEASISENDVENYFKEIMATGEWTSTPNNLLSRVLTYKKNDVDVHISMGYIGPDINLAVACVESQG